MGVFPQMGIINPNILKTIESRTGKNNIEVSKLTSWVRVSSAVEANNHKGIILQSIPPDQNFAMAYGTTGKSGAVGTDFSGTPIYAENDRSHRPSPIIDAIDIQNGHQGLSRKASFSIKCFTLAQAEILTKYFYEPGFVVLVEYGWNLKKSWEQQADLSEDGACEMARYNSYTHITNKRAASGGTYDGFMGRITGGGYKSGDDETYIIDVELTTLGEIPTYLQVHKSGNKSTDTKNSPGLKLNSSLNYTIDTIDDNADDKNKIGLALFQQMYNRLPDEKRTREVKTLTSPSAVDKNDMPWSSPENFINVDDEIRDQLLKGLAGVNAEITNTQGTDTQAVTIPDGVSLMSDQSFIRLELAFEILNTYAVNLRLKDSSKCSGNTPTYSYIIDITETVIGAHKWMFSTDGSKLFIPNTFHPEFGLKAALLADKELSALDFIDPETIQREGEAKTTVNACQFKNSADEEKAYAFPSIANYTSPDLPGTIKRTAPKYSWGYLRNLYINLDFFINVTKRSNFVAKDIYYELLNGISAAAGSYWHFEIIESPYNPKFVNGLSRGKTENQLKIQQAFDNTPEGGEVDISRSNLNSTTVLYPYHMKIEDMNFLGYDGGEVEKIHSFVSKGIDTPFLSSQLDMPIPAIMRNHILGKNSSAHVNTKAENPEETYDGFFSNKLCPVTEILDSFKESNNLPKEQENADDGKSPNPDEIKKANIEFFTSKATIVPTIQDRNGPLRAENNLLKRIFEGTESKFIALDELILVVAWEDTAILKQLELKWVKSQRKVSGTKTPPTISPILSISFSFEVHGISGLKIGDVFIIKDIPDKFRAGVFQIMEQSHSLTDGLWKTSISAKLRNFKIQ